MKHLILSLLYSCLLSLATADAQTGIWQWSIPVRNYSVKPKNPHVQAYLWIPEKCKDVKAVLVAQHNMEEISILEDKEFRQRMAELGVAQVWVCPSFNHGFDFTDGAWETLNGILNDLAKESGYAELATAPLIGIGHSAAASWPYYLAAYNPGRTLACISVSGQWPYYRDKLCKDIWEDRNVDSIPCLETMGEYESAHTWSDKGLKERKEHPLLPLSMLACPAEGHFAYTPEKARYIALYIKKVMQYGHVDPTKTGWLAERWKKDERPSFSPAPVGQYKGDPHEAFWFFDREMAEATLTYQSRYRNLKPQLVSVAQGGKTVPQRNTHLQIHPAFCPEEDGVTLHLTPVFLDTVHGESHRLAAWTGLSVGSRLGHSGAGNPVMQMITGPAIFLDAETLQVRWNRGTLWTDGKAEIVFSIHHPGDGEYKPAVQQAQLTIPIYNKEGEPQQIEFDALKDVNRNVKSVSLHAVSSSGLPVGFYVESGPAYVNGDRLVFTPIPERAAFPVKVTVVAWQYGRSSHPKIQTAKPVRQTFHIRAYKE